MFVKQIFSQKYFLNKNNFSSKKMLVKKNLVKQILGQKTFGWKYLRVKKNFGQDWVALMSKPIDLF